MPCTWGFRTLLALTDFVKFLFVGLVYALITNFVKILFVGLVDALTDFEIPLSWPHVCNPVIIQVLTHVFSWPSSAAAAPQQNTKLENARCWWLTDNEQCSYFGLFKPIIIQVFTHVFSWPFSAATAPQLITKFEHASCRWLTDKEKCSYFGFLERRCKTCTIGTAAMANFKWCRSTQLQLSRNSKEKRCKTCTIGKDAIANFKWGRSCKCSYREFQKSYREFHVKPYREWAAIANFKKDVAKDISLVAPLSRFFLPTYSHIGVP